MNKKRSIIIGATFLMLLIIYLNLDIDGYKGADALESQLNRIIRDHDLEQMRRISSDNLSYTVLSGTSSKDAAVCDTDAQGGRDNLHFYIARLKGNSLGVFMRRQYHFLLGPSYEIDQVKVLPK
ncbi:hypothetical protein EJP77_07525 [Paenibacillus zeisoli]|uniref:Uncharacterized protein n=1 Tax=Paenibacillus zeisoli TaxID=2496267 RepID=A0A3S1D0S7_9BACL|nr:hypothetical protein [Paenibacillus zeisoli]RUT33490.1 hypothetical protein EJP77_07525 [Paenibacillus zeisoli]